MSVDAFFDTNVLIYLLSADQTKAVRSEELIAAGGTVSVQVLNEFANVTLKRHGLAWAVVKENLATFRSVLRVTPLTLETHALGLTLSERHRFSIYDAMIVAAAQMAGCGTLFSEDMQHGRRIGSMSIINPYV